MGKKLKEYFSLIQTRQEVLERIEESREQRELFKSWDEEYREQFLDF